MMKNITIEEIIKRKIKYNREHFEKEIGDFYEGMLAAFEDMLADLNMTESDFIAKYAPITAEHLQNIDDIMDGSVNIPDFGRKSGYNSGILEILTLLDAKYPIELR